jgi:ribose 5-phosphate isomerase B
MRGTEPMKAAIGSDHAGFELKENIRQFLIILDIQAEDLETNSQERVDHPDYAEKACTLVR